MEKIDSQEILHQQRVSLLHHAHIEAMKQIIEKQQPFELSINGALSFREFAKSKIEESEYKELMSIMYQYKESNSSDVSGTLMNLYSILRNYPEVKQAFGMFLPPDLNLKFQTGNYASKDDIVGCKEENDSYSLRKKPESVSSMSSSDSNINVKINNKVSSEYAATYLTKVEECFEYNPEIYQKFLELLPSPTDLLNSGTDFETKIFNGVCELFQEYEELIEEFKPFVPNADYSFQDKIISDASLPSLENASDAEDSDCSEYNEVNDPSIADVYKYGTYEEHLFFDKVRAALVYKEVYNNFLRCLNLYNEDIVTNVELVKVCTSFLGRHPELLKELKDMLGFKENGENYEIIPMKIVNMEDSRCDPETSLDIDYATDGRNGASYRALPKDHVQPLCSSRTPLCKEVLNDMWVSFPSWSEDSTFVTSCKTQYEEIMYRCEDERFEMDMAIQSNSYAIQLLENVQKKINKMKDDEGCLFTLDDTLGGTSTVLYLRALRRLYGAKLEELLAGLKRNPIVAVPLILKRLRFKEEEWKDKQKEFNNHWRAQIDNYYLKSLDHQGINFKQNDSKSFRSKTLLNEMEMVYAEKKENEAFNTFTPHFLLEFKNLSVVVDALNLMNQHLKKLPGIYRTDRSRIEYLIRHFIPDFFGLPHTAVEEEEILSGDDDESIEGSEEKMVMDNQCEERSTNTSPSGSVVCAKEDGLSDQEGSNSAEDNEMSDGTDKSSSFIEEVDIFDKMEQLLPFVKNLPYILFFVNKTWYVFFRQFHILCERLSRLLFESMRKENVIKHEDDEEKSIEYTPNPSYSELIEKLSLLLNGTIDYNQFEEETRSLFGIHAFVSFTMDKLVSCVVRQLQQVVSDDICKQCTSLFFNHIKAISDSPYISLLEMSHVEAEYLRKVEADMNDENCFQVVWHKKDQTLTVQLIEKECDESIPDPCETEKWSQYLENYVSSDTICEDILSEATGLPVFLPRNLKKQQDYWRRKVIFVQNLWKTRHSPSFLKKNPPYSLKRKAAILAKSLQNKMSRQSLKPAAVDSDPKTENESSIDNADNQVTKMEECDNTVDAENICSDDNVSKNQVFLLVDLTDEQDCQEELVECVEEPIQETPLPQEPETSDDPSNIIENKSEDNVNESEETVKDESLQLESNYELQTKLETYVCSDSFQDVVEDDVSNQIRIQTERASQVIEVATHVMENITVEDATEEISSASDLHPPEKEMSVAKEEDQKEVECAPEPEVVKPKVRRPICESTPRTRRKLAVNYMRRRAKRAARSAQSLREKRKKQMKTYEFEDVLFDYANFSALADDDKYTYLALRSVNVVDNTEVSFKQGSYKMFFVQNCDTYIYRKDSLSKSRENHQQISEIKTSNFNAWHKIWMDRYLTPDMIKSCNNWLLKSEPGKFKVIRFILSDCKKSPYIPYHKYKLKYYKVQLSEEVTI